MVLGAFHDAQVGGLEEGMVVETDEVSIYVGARTIPAEPPGRSSRPADAVAAATSSLSFCCHGAALVKSAATLER